MTNDEVQRPDWVMSGARTGDGRYAVMASRSMIDGLIEMERDFGSYSDGFAIRSAPGPTVFTLTSRFRTYVLVVADSYGEALLTLMRQWNADDPDNAGRPEVTSRRPEIDR